MTVIHQVNTTLTLLYDPKMSFWQLLVLQSVVWVLAFYIYIHKLFIVGN